MIAHRFRDRAEDNTYVGKLLFVGSGDRYRIKNHIHCHAREGCAFVHRHTELFKRLEQFRINLIHAREFFL